MCSFVDIERRDKTVHPDGSEEVEVTPYNKVFIGEVRAALLLMEEYLGWRVWPNKPPCGATCDSPAAPGRVLGSTDYLLEVLSSFRTHLSLPWPGADHAAL